MVALWNRADHSLYFHLVSFFFLLLFLFPRLISAVGDSGRKKSPKIAIWAPSQNFVGLYLRN